MNTHTPTKDKAERALAILQDSRKRGIAGIADFLDMEEIIKAYLVLLAEKENGKA